MITLLGLGHQQVGAETIMFSFSGTVTSIVPETIGSIGGSEVVEVGGTIAGSFIYDLDTVGTINGEGPGASLSLPPIFLRYRPGA
jgi:hypothetical protein